MIFYRIGKQLYATQAEAKAVSKDFEQIDVPTDKAGLQAFVQELLDRPEPEPEPEPSFVPVAPVQQQSYAQYSVDLDEVFENLPLAHQLHFAAIAMENARKKVK